jgi:SAM-dependent methyltransferase
MTPEDAFFHFYEGLPRQGPGDRANLDRALALLDLPQDAAVLDAGCGVGADISGLLEHAPEGTVEAVDTHPPFIAKVRASHAGDPRVRAATRGMADCAGPYDLVWCAGALYFLGLEAGLAWAKSALKPGGGIVFSEPCFFAEDPSPEARAFWVGQDATILTEAEIARVTEAEGFRVLDARPLDDAAWEAYYRPMEARIATLNPGAPEALAEVLAASSNEAATWRRVRRETGYTIVTAVRV